MEDEVKGPKSVARGRKKKGEKDVEADKWSTQFKHNLK